MRKGAARSSRPARRDTLSSLQPHRMDTFQRFVTIEQTTGLPVAFVAAVLALVFIDAEHMILPNVITYPGIAVALAARALVPNLYGVAWLGAQAHLPAWLLSVVGAVLGALVGGGFLWLVGWLWERL